LGRKLEHLTSLRELGFQTNRRVLHVQKTSQDFILSEVLFRKSPILAASTANALPPGVSAIPRARTVRYAGPVSLVTCGFRSRNLREHIAPLLGHDPSQWTQGD